jgi:uncharacterized repeat protein (TIGR03803 family)
VKFSPNSQGTLTETVLYNFAHTPDGARPFALLLDGSGNLWGLTESGGKNQCGTIFELTPTAHGRWNESALLPASFVPSSVPHRSPKLSRSAPFRLESAACQTHTLAPLSCIGSPDLLSALARLSQLPP